MGLDSSSGFNKRLRVGGYEFKSRQKEKTKIKIKITTNILTIKKKPMNKNFTQPILIFEEILNR